MAGMLKDQPLGIYQISPDSENKKQVSEAQMASPSGSNEAIVLDASAIDAPSQQSTFATPRPRLLVPGVGVAAARQDTSESKRQEKKDVEQLDIPKSDSIGSIALGAREIQNSELGPESTVLSEAPTHSKDSLPIATNLSRPIPRAAAFALPPKRNVPR